MKQVSNNSNNNLARQNNCAEDGHYQGSLFARESSVHSFCRKIDRNTFARWQNKYKWKNWRWHRFAGVHSNSFLDKYCYYSYRVTILTELPFLYFFRRIYNVWKRNRTWKIFIYFQIISSAFRTFWHVCYNIYFIRWINQKKRAAVPCFCLDYVIHRFLKSI